jgi:hypothetical protein
MVNLTTFLASNDNDPARRAECGRMINAFEQLMVEVTEEATSTVSNSSCTNGTILLN